MVQESGVGTDGKPRIAEAMPVTLKINKKQYSIDVDPRTSLQECISRVVTVIDAGKIMNPKTGRIEDLLGETT